MAPPRRLSLRLRFGKLRRDKLAWQAAPGELNMRVRFIAYFHVAIIINESLSPMMIDIYFQTPSVRCQSALRLIFLHLQSQADR